jgi:hypothetical protein
LLISHTLFKFLDLITKAATLAFGNLFEVLLGLNLFVFDVDEALGVHEFHLNGFEVLVQNLKSLLVLLDF